MSLKKTVAIVAAAGALAAISVPAMAMENEFHGSYTFNTMFSNFQDGASGNFTPAGFRENRQMNNYFEQRARLQYTAKVSDDLKLVTQFELDTRFGGITDGKYNGSSDAGVLDADGISLETKHVYLDFNLGNNFNTKLGIQPYKDTLKGIFLDADIPAIMTNTKLGNYTLGVGYSRFSESQQTGTAVGRLGDLSKDLFILDNTYAYNKDTKVAFSYYLLADYQTADQAKLVNTFGLSGETKVGPVALSGFAAMQAGHQKGQIGVAKSSVNFHGWAANVGAKMNVGPGTARTAFLFVSGNNNSGDAQDRGWQVPTSSSATIGVTSYNEGNMMILIRSTANSPTTTDRYIRRNTSNIAVATLGYDANLTDKVYANGNVGFGWVPSSAGAPIDKATGGRNASDFLGTELNLEAGYKVNPNLTLRAQGAYMILGSNFKGSATTDAPTIVKDPENPYTMRLLASFRF